MTINGFPFYLYRLAGSDSSPTLHRSVFSFSFCIPIVLTREICVHFRGQQSFWRKKENAFPTNADANRSEPLLWRVRIFRMV